MRTSFHFVTFGIFVFTTAWAFPSTHVRRGRHGSRHSMAVLTKRWSSTSSSLGEDTVTDTDTGGCKVGDTKGAVLLLENVSVSRGPRDILQNVNWRVERGERWGLVGANGSGKSTLLGAVIGSIDMNPPNSKALVAPKTRVGYLRQTAVSDSSKTVFDEVTSSMTDVREALAFQQRATAAVEAGDVSPQALNRLDQANDAVERCGGYELEARVDEVLHGLGFYAGASQQPCQAFSGGWQMRIGLAKLLLERPTLLLLDEPSNHLDASARQWLCQYLRSYGDDNTIVVVSHDRELLEGVVQHIAEVSGSSAVGGSTLHTYRTVTYEQYKEQKAFRAKSQLAEYEKNVAEAAKLQEFVDRFGATATKAKSAQSKVKAIEKMKAEGKLDPPDLSLSAIKSTKSKSTKDEFTPTLQLPDPPKLQGDNVIRLINCDIGYPVPASSEDQQEPVWLLKSINLEIRAGMKLVLVGKNGAGKSTLLKALYSSLQPSQQSSPPLVSIQGLVETNEKLRLGLFTQDLAQQLPPHERAVDVVLQNVRTGHGGDVMVSDQTARSVLGGLGLGGDKALGRIQELSGGEKARVALAVFCLRPSNLVIMDEPSNHLDRPCLDVLARALAEWPGTVVVVSHDRTFCEAIDNHQPNNRGSNGNDYGGFTHVGTVDNGTLVVEERNLRESDWQLQGQGRGGQGQSPTKGTGQQPLTTLEGPSMTGVDTTGTATDTATTTVSSLDRGDTQKRQKEMYNAPKKMQRLEASIIKTEDQIQQLDQQMLEHGHDVGKLVDLQKEKEVLQQKVNDWWTELEALEALLAA